MNDTANKVIALRSLADIPANGGTFRDAYISGPLDPALLARQITVAFGNSAKAVEWKNSSLTFKDLAELLCTFGRGTKDGLCMLQGALAVDGGRRSSKGMKALYLLVYDLDAGLTLEQVADKLPVAICAILWTTHSHNKRESFISESAIMKELERTAPGPTIDEAVAHVIKRTKAKPDIFEGAALSVREHTENGIGYRLQHKPWPKARVLFLLEEPFVFAERGGLQSDAIAELKARSSAFAESLGLPVDKSCTDPGHLFFTPRIPVGAELSDAGDDGLHDIWIVPGNPLDLEAVKLPPTPKKPGKTEKTAKTESSQAEPGTFDWARLSQALDFIPADDRKVWLDVGMALHHESSGSVEGLDLWDDWSEKKAPDKYDADDQDRVWKSFDGKGDRLITAGTLYKMAKEGGWTGRPPLPFEVIETPPEPATGPRLIRVSSLGDKLPPPREWHIPGLMAASNATLLFGDGATGKSLLAAQLAVATVLRRMWIGFGISRPGPTLYIGAEDDEDEMHRRFHAIAASYGAKLSDLHDLHLYCLAGHDAVLGAVDRNEIVGPTKLWGTVREMILDIKPSLTVFDTLADLFAGNENSRGQARQFVSQLRRPAIETKGSALLLAHPSLSGMASGTGMSGSTGWSNSVRSRLYLTRLTRSGDGGEVDPDVRVLKTMKVNYAGQGDEHKVRWQDGVFVPDIGKGPVVVTEAELRADAKFLELLTTYNRTGQDVSPSRSVSYAPTVFARDQRGKGIKKMEFEAAMNCLFSQGKIRIEAVGSPSRRTKRLVLTEIESPRK